MLILTSIKPRTSGVVIAREGETVYTFAPDAAGDLVCDVHDEAVVRRLLLTGLFEPANETDFSRAEAVMAAGDAADGEDEDDDADDEGNEDALPIEAHTAPVAKRKPGRPRKA